MVAVVARTAAAHGAHVATRVRVTGFRAPGEVEAVDEETGEALRAARPPRGGRRGRVDRPACASSPAGARRGGSCRRRASTCSSPRDRIPMDTGVLARTEKSVLFVIPWQGGWLIGDTDTPWSGGPDRPSRPARTSTTCSRRRTRCWPSRCGATTSTASRPACARSWPRRRARDTTRISRQHVVESPAPRLTTIAGGKYTTYRVMAADLVDAVARALGGRAASVTRDVPLLRRAAPSGRAAHRRPDSRRYGALPTRARRADRRRPRLAGAARRRRRAPARRGRPRVHARGRAAPRGRARAAHPARAHRARPRPARGRARGRADGRRARLAPDRTQQEVEALAGAGRRAAAPPRPSATTGGRSPPTRDARRARRRPGAAVSRLVLGLDQGTSSTRCVALDEELRERGAAPLPVACSFPGPGLVEQDPEALAASAERAIAGRARRGRRRPGRRRRARHRQPDRDVRRLGARTGRARPPRDRVAGPADRRGVRRAPRARGAGARAHRARARRDVPGDEAALAARRRRRRRPRLRRRGVLAAAPPRRRPRRPTPATPPARCCARSAAATGTTSCSSCSASRAALLPPIVDSDAIDAEIEGVPVRAAVGDQQASLFGLRCWEPGTAKVTLGTGAFVLAQAGEERPAPPPGILASAAWRRAGSHQLRARGLHPDRRRGRRLVRAHRRAPRRAGARRAAARGGRRRRRLRPRAPGPGQPDLGRGRARRRARPQPRHHAAPTSRAR